MFCFAEPHCHTSATEIEKVQPDLDNKEVATWPSLDLIETLLYLADNQRIAPLHAESAVQSQTATSKEDDN